MLVKIMNIKKIFFTAIFGLGIVFLRRGVSVIIAMIILSSPAFAQNNNFDPLQEYFIRSIIATENSIPNLAMVPSESNLYRDFFEEKQKNLVPLFEIDSDFSQYKLKKFSASPKIFIGYPPYLKPRFEPSDGDVLSATKVIEGLLDGLKKDVTFFNFEISQTSDDASVILIPVTPRTFIEVANPNIKVSPLMFDNYEGVTLGLEKVFLNHNLFSTNGLGLKGTFLSDNRGNIIISYCPIDVGLGVKSTQDSILYCVIQAQGVPGFYKVFPQIQDESLKWAEKILRLINCPDVKADQNFFNLNFSVLKKKCFI